LLGQKAAGSYSTILWLKDKINTIFWNIRELNSCEHGVGILIILAPFLYCYAKDKRLLRCPMAIFTYVVVVAFLAPNEAYNMATVRYLAVIIPACIFTSVLSIEVLTARAKWLAVPLALLAFGTNVLHGGPLVGFDNKAIFSKAIAQGYFRSTVVEYVGELINPPPSTYRVTSHWINKNLEEKETVWVMPSFATYPLMYHAPKAVYAWQLEQRSDEQFSKLPRIHFKGEFSPDYAIAFGPYVDHMKAVLKKLEVNGIRYAQVEQIDQYWYDLIRPELIWHSFREIKNFSRQSQAIYIFKKINPS